MDILLSNYGQIFTEFESLDRGGLSNSVNIRPYLYSIQLVSCLWKISLNNLTYANGSEPDVQRSKRV